MSENIPNILLNKIADKLELSPNLKDTWQNKLTDLKEQFLKSEAVVYCEDCGLIFYSGIAKSVINEKHYVDWKLLSFRHVWDTKHKVKIYLPFFLAADKIVENKDKKYSKLINNVRQQFLGFDNFNQVCYYLEVEKLRERLINMGSVKAQKSHDSNWDVNSRCECSVCYTSFYDPKEACNCHSEQKPWLPLNEVELINVRRLN